jgi:hypothetical protein
LQAHALQIRQGTRDRVVFHLKAYSTRASVCTLALTFIIARTTLNTRYTIYGTCALELVISFHAAVAVLGAQSYYLFFYYVPVCVRARF